MTTTIDKDALLRACDEEIRLFRALSQALVTLAVPKLPVEDQIQFAALLREEVLPMGRRIDEMYFAAGLDRQVMTIEEAIASGR